MLSFSSMRCAAINSGPDFHLLDHIAPLSNLMQMPLIVTEELNFSLSTQYYPFVSTQLMYDIDHNLGLLAEQFDTLFECKYFAPHLKQLFFDFYKKKMRLIHCSHGQSDKGYASATLRHYATQDAALIYGPLLKTMLKELNIHTNLIMTGNYRLNFYLQHKEFYDDLAERKVFSHLPAKNKNLLYAPTWKDSDSSSSFFTHAASIFSELPQDWNLILKLHPLLEQRDPAQFYRVASFAQNHPNILLLSEFPPVYPILAKSDVYLGDYSSVGYDFLYFKRPMFFLLHPELPKGRLHSCGTILDSPKALFSKIDQEHRFTENQKALYAYAFADPQSPLGGSTKTELISLISNALG